MSRAIYASLAAASAGAALSGCASAPVQTASSYADHGAVATYHAAGTGVHAVYATGSDIYSGVGTAAKQPFHDLNMMQDPIPAVLLRAEAHPYDTAGLTSCQAILNHVAELDLALGPDLDAPKDQGKDRTTRVATLAAAAALDAASSAAEGFLPMRSVIKHVSGATRYEDHVKHAVLAGTVRRGFLKALGMEHNCGWPAAPLDFQPASVTVATTPLALPATARAPGAAAPSAPIYASASVAHATYGGAQMYRAALSTPPSQAAVSQGVTSQGIASQASARPAVLPLSATPDSDAAPDGPPGGWSAADPSPTASTTSSTPAVASASAALTPSAAFAAPWAKPSR